MPMETFSAVHHLTVSLQLVLHLGGVRVAGIVLVSLNRAQPLRLPRAQ